MDNKKYLKLIQDYDKHCRRIALATSINIHESAKEKNDRIRKLERNYIAWFEYYFPNYAKKKSAWFHAKLAKVITQNKRLRLLAEMFRSAGKSVHIDMGIPLYLYLAKKDLHFMLLVGETEPKAKKLLSGIQAQLQFNNRIKNDYGECFSAGNWAEGDFATSDGVRFMSLGFGQNPRGAREQAERPDYIVVDDVDSKKSVNNDRIMREAVDYITEDIWGCFDADDNATERFIYANNNFHKNSITNRLKTYFNQVIKDEKENSATIEQHANALFHVLSVCAVKNLSDFTPEWPEKTSAEYWRNKFSQMPYRSFMREYMHTHIEDGAIFKYEDIQYKKPHKLKDYDALCFYGDLSYKANADYKALILVGTKGKEFHILLAYMQQKSRADCAKWLYDQYEVYNLDLYNIRYMIEGLFAMDEFVSDFDIEGEKRGYYIPVVADKRTKTDKYDRIESLSGYFERKNVFFNSEQKNADMQTLIDQFLAFEKGSQAHDDGPDAVHGAFKWLSTRNRKMKGTYKFGARVNNRY
ncbi:phage terminase large subunit [Candidatus Ornithobacterium hominis]|uniref:phage terminase large subunit n=1 Tax=Candidatus Ornithobacterium hominis TaxID=2497989 RepID=UPI0024BC50BC|nr:phage terminase large subunit [Candidatus Ornithobacterium hominis]CAI9429255.1 phage terminase large subunit [Candidatus Ornithobacterium hominis]